MRIWDHRLRSKLQLVRIGAMGSAGPDILCFGFGSMAEEYPVRSRGTQDMSVHLDYTFRSRALPIGYDAKDEVTDILVSEVDM